jgi:diacylglycerol kinase family enzyme
MLHPAACNELPGGEQCQGIAAAKIACVLNCKANSEAARAAENEIANLFKKHGADATVLIPQAGQQILLVARQAVDNGASLLVAAGGDGTINAVSQAVINTETTLGVLPLGTLNHFAKDLGIPLDLEPAVINVLKGRTVRIDVGEVNGKPFLNNSSLGLYPAIVHQREKAQRAGDGKWWAFGKAIVRALRHYPKLYVTLQTSDGSRTENQTPFVFIGNNRYEVCGFEIGKRTRLDEGRLWVYRAPRASRTGLLRLALRAILGGHQRGQLEIIATKECRIDAGGKRVRVATDGEVHLLESPLDYRTIPKALKVIVPASLQD